MEWLLPNGIGGFAMGTASGANTRRYHGHLVAATRAPEVRTVLLAGIEAFATVQGETYGVSTNQYVGAVHPQGFRILKEFSVSDVAQWVFEVGPTTLTKRLGIHSGQNACTVSYTNSGPEGVALTLRPLVSHKFYHENFRFTDFYPEFMLFPEDRTVLTHQGLTLSLEHPGAARTPTTGWFYRFEHEREVERGLDPLDDLFCPCELTYFLEPGAIISLVAATTEGVAPIDLPPVEAVGNASLVERLESAAGDFIVKANGRTTVLAGYPWFTDWGRDTMVALPGICLETGHIEDAKAILRGYASRMDHGLVPNRFSDHKESVDTNTVDATLWFANAVHLTLEKEWDGTLAKEAFGWLKESHEWHLKGTLFGIKMDPRDGLLTQGAPGVQLTWMDAKVGDWVVTPRHGKPVEVNGLWVNMLRVLAQLAEKLGEPFEAYNSQADHAQQSMMATFWHERLGYFLDTADPADASLRPNQLVAMALPFAPLSGPNVIRALETIERELLTPFGIRTLGPGEPGYRGRFEGHLSERDAAYHQGSAWPWLLGAYVAAVVRHTGDIDRARAALAKVPDMLDSCGLGSIAEVYDGDTPQYAGGCPFQAWSVGEVLRAVKLVGL